MPDASADSNILEVFIMKTMIVDDEKISIEIIKYLARDIAELDIECAFEDAEMALEYLGYNDIDLVILDINMQGMDGIDLGVEIRRKFPDIKIIYITGEMTFPKAAIELRAEAYITKPCTLESLEYAIESARFLSLKKRKRVFARTFGYFDLFVEGKPVMFKSAKAKELLALLIDHQGGTVTSDQIIGTLWEDRPNDITTQSLCSKICKTLEKELRDNGAGDILVTSRGVKYLDTDKFECDLYMLLEGSRKMAKRYIGEYMMEYSWAENKVALLNKYLSIC